MPITFRSAVDGWYYGMLLVVPLLIFVPALLTRGANPASMSMLIPLLFACVLGLGLPLWLLFSTYYVVDENELLIRSGPFTWHVPRADIVSITPSRSLLSSPALSLDRLLIDYGRGRQVMVSPRDQADFLAALASTPR